MQKIHGNTKCKCGHKRSVHDVKKQHIGCWYHDVGCPCIKFQKATTKEI